MDGHIGGREGEEGVGQEVERGTAKKERKEGGASVH